MKGIARCSTRAHTTKRSRGADGPPKITCNSAVAGGDEMHRGTDTWDSPRPAPPSLASWAAPLIDGSPSTASALWPSMVVDRHPIRQCSSSQSVNQSRVAAALSPRLGRTADGQAPPQWREMTGGPTRGFTRPQVGNLQCLVQSPDICEPLPSPRFRKLVTISYKQASNRSQTARGRVLRASGEPRRCRLG